MVVINQYEFSSFFFIQTGIKIQILILVYSKMDETTKN